MPLQSAPNMFGRLDDELVQRDSVKSELTLPRGQRVDDQKCGPSIQSTHDKLRRRRRLNRANLPTLTELSLAAYIECLNDNDT